MNIIIVSLLYCYNNIYIFNYDHIKINNYLINHIKINPNHSLDLLNVQVSLDI